LWHQKSNARVNDQQQTRISPFSVLRLPKIICAPPRSNALTIIYPPTRVTDFAQVSTQVRRLDTCATHPFSGALPNAEFYYARQKNQQVKPRTSALPELRAGHAPGSKDPTF
jgi:hypothetical protein